MLGFGTVVLVWVRVSGRVRLEFDGWLECRVGDEFLPDSQSCSRHGSGSHFVTQRPSDPGIQRPGDPVDPVTPFYNELQMSTYV